MTRTAVIAGVGPGLGAALARRFAAADCSLGLLARSSDVIDDLEAELDDALAVETDISDRDAVEAAFAEVREAFGPVDVLVVNASTAPWQGTLDITPAEFESALDANVRGALHCAQEAVPDMLVEREGTVVFTGATTSVRGRGGAIGFSAAKFAARGMAESMARELDPEGIHVAHVVVDGQILPPEGPAPDRDTDEYLDPEAIADEYWRLVEQDRSAWTLELDLRPHVESF